MHHHFMQLHFLKFFTRTLMNMDKQQQFKRVFGHIDINGDGKISPPELQTCIGKIGGELSIEEVEMAAELMDSDGDGLLSMEDLVRVVESANEEETINDLKMAYKMYGETEGSGCITPKSLRRMLSKLGESRTVDDCKMMIAKFDVNGDGVLSFEEFREMMVL